MHPLPQEVVPAPAPPQLVPVPVVASPSSSPSPVLVTSGSGKLRLNRCGKLAFQHWDLPNIERHAQSRPECLAATDIAVPLPAFMQAYSGFALELRPQTTSGSQCSFRLRLHHLHRRARCRPYPSARLLIRARAPARA